VVDTGLSKDMRLLEIIEDEDGTGSENSESTVPQEIMIAIQLSADPIRFGCDRLLPRDGSCDLANMRLLINSSSCLV